MLIITFPKLYSPSFSFLERFFGEDLPVKIENFLNKFLFRPINKLLSFFEIISFSDEDIYDLDSTLSPIILHSLQRFEEASKNDIGFPSVILKEYLEEKQLLEENLTEKERIVAEEFCLTLWKSYIKSMIYSFSELSDPQDEPRLKLPNTTLNDDFKKVFLTKEQILENDKYIENFTKDYEIYDERISKGLFLFQKHYRDLWW